MDNEQIKQWIMNNLCTREVARGITGQSDSAFGQSLATGRISPFVELESGKRVVRLYLRSDLEKYAKAKKQ